MKKGKKPASQEETKRDKFKRVVKPRVSRAVKAIRLIGNCSGSAYEYTESDLTLIMIALQAAVEQLARRYQSKVVSTFYFNAD